MRRNKKQMKNKRRNNANCVDNYNYCISNISSEQLLVWWQETIGILSKAQSAKEKTRQSSVTEALRLAYTTAVMDKYTDGTISDMNDATAAALTVVEMRKLRI